jgi:hypothetical protein
VEKVYPPVIMMSRWDVLLVLHCGRLSCPFYLSINLFLAHGFFEINVKSSVVQLCNQGSGF